LGKLREILEGQRSCFIVNLSPDKSTEPDNDEEMIIIEVKSGAVYNMAFFFVRSETADARKAMSVCHKVEEEFEIRMGC
jgi:hypothetical protein